jgi:PAS domain S-box-containing protein
MIDSANDAIISKDLDSRITSWNKAAQRIFGYSAEEAIGRSILIIVPPELHQEELAIFEKVLNGERIDHYETIRVRKDGSKLNISLTISPINGADGKIVGVSKIARDVSEEKHADSRIRLIADSLPVLIAYIDKKFRYRFANRTYFDWFGKRPDEVIGKKISEIVGPTAYEEVLPQTKKALSGERVSFEQKIHYRDGDEHFISGDYVPDVDLLTGEVRGFFALVRDITDRKRHEEALRKSEEALRDTLASERTARKEAEEIIRLRDEFLTTISHELRTPLNSILGWAGMLAAGTIDLDVSRAAETIFRNAKAQAQLIDDILDVSRIITGKIRLETQPIMVAPVIEQAVESLRPAIDARNINFAMELSDEGHIVLADPDRLQQVIWNLLSNAIKFTPENGNVAIRVSSTDSKTMITVSDTGIGIRPEFLPYVFDRFRQADGSSTRKHGGIGLGLAIVRHLVELHGGTISVSSDGENMGTTFSVILRAGPSTPDNIDPEKEAEHTESLAFIRNTVSEKELAGMKILAVDDKQDSLEMLTVLLKGKGAEVRTFLSAKEALETIGDWKPDVLISDIAMPDEDGYFLIRTLRARPPEEGGLTPAIALTAYVAAKEKEKVLESGYQKYLSKPVVPAELIRAVSDLAARR